MWSREQGLLENQNTLMLPTWDSVFLLIFLFSENSYFINISWRPLQVYYCIFLFYANWSSHDSPVLLCFLLCCRIYYFHWVFFTCLHLPSLTTKWSKHGSHAYLSAFVTILDISCAFDHIKEWHLKFHICLHLNFLSKYMWL